MGNGVKAREIKKIIIRDLNFDLAAIVVLIVSVVVKTEVSQKMRLSHFTGLSTTQLSPMFMTHISCAKGKDSRHKHLN